MHLNLKEGNLKFNKQLSIVQHHEQIIYLKVKNSMQHKLNRKLKLFHHFSNIKFFFFFSFGKVRSS